MAILTFLFNPQIKGKVGFDFYTEFVKKFQKNIDQIKLLKIIKEVITSLPCNISNNTRKITTWFLAPFLIKVGIHIINQSNHPISIRPSPGIYRLQPMFRSNS